MQVNASSLISSRLIDEPKKALLNVNPRCVDRCEQFIGVVMSQEDAINPRKGGSTYHTRV